MVHYITSEKTAVKDWWFVQIEDEKQNKAFVEVCIANNDFKMFKRGFLNEASCIELIYVLNDWVAENKEQLLEDWQNFDPYAEKKIYKVHSE